MCSEAESVFYALHDTLVYVRTSLRPLTDHIIIRKGSIISGPSVRHFLLSFAKPKRMIVTHKHIVVARANLFIVTDPNRQLKDVGYCSIISRSKFQNR